MGSRCDGGLDGAHPRALGRRAAPLRRRRLPLRPLTVNVRTADVHPPSTALTPPHLAVLDTILTVPWTARNCLVAFGCHAGRCRWGSGPTGRSLPAFGSGVLG